MLLCAAKSAELPVFPKPLVTVTLQWLAKLVEGGKRRRSSLQPAFSFCPKMAMLQAIVLGMIKLLC